MSKNSENLISRFSDHLQEFAILYVIASYVIFVIVNILAMKMDNPYGVAMVTIGVFWLGVMRLSRWLKNKYNN